MNQPYVRSEVTSSFSGLPPRAWLTNSQLEHLENFTGSEMNRRLANAIRGQEQVGYDGMVRALPATSISYEASLRMLGMGQSDDLRT